jgi:hypothetical protein
MDPYLEDPVLWPEVHQRLITYTADALQPLLRPRGYRARIGERLILSFAGAGLHAVIPDVTLKSEPLLAPRPESVGAGGVAVWEPLVAVADEPMIREAGEVREVYLEIRDARGEEVITVIEVLSPTNKLPTGYGHPQYLEKQREILDSFVHLVEIDLLRDGFPTVAASALLHGEPYDYVVCVRRAPRRDRFELYLATVRDRLPRVRIPLRAGDPDVVLDLPTIFNRCYDNGDYGSLIDYTAPLDPPLSLVEAAWADQLLREKGRRPTKGDPVNA